MTLPDACLGQFGRATIDELATDAVPSAVRMNREMMDISASAVVSRKDCSNKPPVVSGNEAHTHIAVKISLNVLARICVTQGNPIALTPQGQCIIIGFYSKLRYFYHGVLSVKSAG